MIRNFPKRFWRWASCPPINDTGGHIFSSKLLHYSPTDFSLVECVVTASSRYRKKSGEVGRRMMTHSGEKSKKTEKVAKLWGGPATTTSHVFQLMSEFFCGVRPCRTMVIDVKILKNENFASTVFCLQPQDFRLPRWPPWTFFSFIFYGRILPNNVHLLLKFHEEAMTGSREMIFF